MASSTEIIEALREIEDAEGRLTPRTVVDAARDPSNPLHGEFIWDDAKAAEKQRLDTARKLLRVKVNYRHEHLEFKVPRYIRDPEAPQRSQGYRNTMRVAREEDHAHASLVAEFKRAGDALRRARHLGTMYGLAEDIEALETQVAAVRERLDEASATVQ